MSFNFPVYQLNCQKRDVSATAVQLITKSLPSFLAFLTEPYIHSSRLACLDRSHTRISALDVRPRAAIYAHRNQNLWPVQNLCSRDTCTAIWDTRSKAGNVLVVSHYWDISVPDLAASLQDVVSFSKERNLPLWFSMDSNSHSTLWNCSETNSRGRALERFLFANNLSVLNRGNKPTWQNSRGHNSIIDVTLVSNSLVKYVSDWHVSSEHVSSDHNLIRMTFRMPQPVTRKVRKIRKALLPQFTDKLDALCSELPEVEITSLASLEEEGSLLISLAQKVRDELFPESESTSKASIYHWMTEHINNMRKTLCKARKKNSKRPSQPFHQTYKDLEKEYEETVRSARQQSFRTFASDVDSVSSMSNLCKILTKAESPGLGLLQTPSGELSKDLAESANILLDKAFPQSLPLSSEDVSFQDECRRLRNLMTPIDPAPSLGFFSEDNIQKSFSQFKNSKACGPDGLKPLLLKSLPLSFLRRLRKVFEASYVSGYTPSGWQEASVIFIPKPGKDDYSLPSSFRPISLMSFVFKGMERLVY